MIKIALTMVVTAVAGIVGYFLSDTYKERQAQRQRRPILHLSRIAKECSQAITAAHSTPNGR